MEKKLSKLLQKIYLERDKNFSGLGIIVYNELDNIPIFPLKNNSHDKYHIEDLIGISNFNNPYHDGFHCISKDWKLTHVSQYFSPPIDKSLVIKTDDRYGGRYMAALFGSTLSSIILTGIISKCYGPTIFQNGKLLEIEK